MELKHGLTVAALYGRDGLIALDAAFVAHLTATEADLAAALAAARADPRAIEPKACSDLLIALAPVVEDFVADLFGITAEVAALRRRHGALAPLYAVKRLFVQRRALKAVAPAELAGLDGDHLAAALAPHLGRLMGGPADELAFAVAVEAWLADEADRAEALGLALRYAAWATLAPRGIARHGKGLLFRQPRKLDPFNLVRHMATSETAEGRRFQLEPGHLRQRRGFALTDPGCDLAGALDQAHYCIWCHGQGKDSCAKGLREKPAGAAAPAYRSSVSGIALAGCPLEEKISEMHAVKAQGFAIGALAMIAVDNPLCAGTGHRICNDCMKSCIYQKQEPVDIPQAETRSLKDVLALPCGFEIYSLLTRWNPLDLARPLPRPASGRKVLVVGLGPAGYTLAHHLMNDGHLVVAVDGLKIEPLPEALSGVTPKGARVPFRAIRDSAELQDGLEARVNGGFGGVAEYGITVRWDKNFLKLIRLLLERRDTFAMVGGVRFGGTLGLDEAFALGFDHIALCMGAGRPTVLDLPNGLARGVRTASDFLMALQLTGAAKADSIANLQIRLPVVVVGGGLTAIDTATEALAYYPVQVEKFLSRYETLAAERGEAAVRARWTAEEAGIADEFLGHARALRAECEAARAEGRPADPLRLLQGWGGATMAYRRHLVEAPSYTLNHEEVEKALEEGITIAEDLAPAAVEVDGFGHVCALVMDRMGRDEAGRRTKAGSVTLPAGSVLVAAGTQPNTVLAREDGRIALDGKWFQAQDEAGRPVSPERVAKPELSQILVHRHADGRAVSFFGDLHPSFAGNVVKAMGGAKQGYPLVSRLLAGRAPATAEAGFLDRLNGLLRAELVRVERLTPTIVEVVVRAPLAARAFRPGQFYRLQNFESLAPRVAGTCLAMEGLALTGAWTDPEQGLLGLIVLEMGGSSDLCVLLRPGEPLVLMGPTGTPTETPAGETVLLAGGGLGNAVLFSIGQALRAAGSRVVYVAGYKKRADRYKAAEIERAADLVVWACDEAPGFTPGRPQDRRFVGDIVEAIRAYGEGRLGPPEIPLSAVGRLIAIGSDKMMAAVGAARHGVLAPLLGGVTVALGSINSPMQCMLKEICAQCLQPQIDPVTGARSVVFSCFNQDQALDRVDFAALDQRLRQNGVQEKLTAQWVDRCLAALGVRAGAA